MDQISFSARQFLAVSAPSEVSMLDAGEGIRLWAFGMLVTLKALGNETNGLFALHEDVVFPGRGHPAHMHTLEDEAWYLLEGELLWKVGGKEYHAKEGSFIHLPSFIPHAFENKFDKPARMLVTFAPAGLERWFLQVGKPATDQGVPPPLTRQGAEWALQLEREYGVVTLGDMEKETGALPSQYLGTSLD